MRGLVWFRRDLRIHDHPALFHACRYSQDGMMAVYIIDRELWRKNDNSAIQVDFIIDGLHFLKKRLENIGVSLSIQTVDSTDNIPQCLYKLALQYKVSKIFWNREDEYNESVRDRKVQEFLTKQKLSYEIFCDQLIIDAPHIQTESGHWFRVFSPFRRKWLHVFREQGITILPVPSAVKPIRLQALDVGILPSFSRMGETSQWTAGEAFAQKKLHTFCLDPIFSYDKTRDFPSLGATSGLSPWLATGMLSPKVCFNSALQANEGELDSGSKGAVIFMSELIWREFYRHILIHVPHISRGKAYLPETEKLAWRNNQADLEAWQSGQTGFPLVDAGMRQLNATGWMHNRLRMVTAMFLSKNLLLDWRHGEKYFASHLIDFDFASNNGGWQWCASTGTDASPWFRVFNPILQSQRFDPQGTFIRRFCPELAALSDRDIHEPWKIRAGTVRKIVYPKPIVDLPASRQRVLAAFSALKGR